MSTGPAASPVRVPITSSASYPGTPTRAIPSASSTASITGTCGDRVSGTTSMSAAPDPWGASSATRWALYEGMSSTRH